MARPKLSLNKPKSEAVPEAEEPRQDEGEDQEVVIDPSKNPGNIARQSIADAYEHAMANEPPEVFPEVDEDNNPIVRQEPKEEPETPEAEPEQTEEAVEAAPQADQPASVFDPSKEYELKVDGKLIKVKGDRILLAGYQTLQKESAADMRLEAATRLLRDAEAKSGATTGAPKDEPATPQPSELSDAELARAIQLGTVEEAEAAIRMLRSRGQSAQEINTLVAREIQSILPQQLEAYNAVNWAKDEYGYILNDPMLANVFGSEYQRLRQAQDPRSDRDVFKAIGEAMTTAFNLKRPEKAPMVEERQQRKAAAPRQPSVNGGRSASSTPDDVPQTHEQIIAEMRQRRGQLRI